MAFPTLSGFGPVTRTDIGHGTSAWASATLVSEGRHARHAFCFAAIASHASAWTHAALAILPDLSRERQGAVTLGTLQPDGGFRAQEVLVRHDESSMPKNKVEALQRTGPWCPKSSTRHRQPQPGTRWRRIRLPADEQNGAPVVVPEPGYMTLAWGCALALVWQSVREPSILTARST